MSTTTTHTTNHHRHFNFSNVGREQVNPLFRGRTFVPLSEEAIELNTIEEKMLDLAKQDAIVKKQDIKDLRNKAFFLSLNLIDRSSYNRILFLADRLLLKSDNPVLAPKLPVRRLRSASVCIGESRNLSQLQLSLENCIRKGYPLSKNTLVMTHKRAFSLNVTDPKSFMKVHMMMYALISKASKRLSLN